VRELISLLPELHAVVLVGAKAGRAETASRIGSCRVRVGASLAPGPRPALREMERRYHRHRWEVCGTPTTITCRPAREKWSQTRSMRTALESATVMES